MTLATTLAQHLSLGLTSLVVFAAPLASNSAQAVNPLPLAMPPTQTVNLEVIDPESGELSASLSFNLDKTASAPNKLNRPNSPPKPIKTPPESPYEDIFSEYANQFGVDQNLLKHIAWCEAHYHPDSVSASGTYGGMYQFSASTWASTRAAMGADPNPDLRFDAREAILTAAFKLAAGGRGAWPVCGR